MLDGKAGYVSASGGVDAPGADPGAAGVVLAAVPAVRAGSETAAGRRAGGFGSRAGSVAAPGTALDAALTALGVGLVTDPEVGWHLWKN